MSGRRRDQPEDESFASAVKGVRRLPGRGGKRPPEAPGKGRAGQPEPGPARSDPQLVSWIRPDPQEPLLGYAKGIDRRTLERLRTGEIHPERELDLHGLLADAAREALRVELCDARERGLRCVRVVHGRGLHSRGAPVLREALPRWLGEPPLASWVLAFTPAPRKEGGAGATTVLLRRTRGR